MTKEQAIEKMRYFGYTEDEINYIVQLNEEARLQGIKIPWELEAMPKPLTTEYPATSK